MKKRLIAIIAGLLFGTFAIYFGESISHQWYPPPANLEPEDIEAYKEFVIGLPTSALLVHLVISMFAGLIGGFIAASIHQEKWRQVSLVTGFGLLVATAGNMYMISYPNWIILLTVLVYLPMAYLGGLLSRIIG